MLFWLEGSAKHRIAQALGRQYLCLNKVLGTAIK